MLCFSYRNFEIVPGIEHSDFYSPLFSGTIKEASIRIITGGGWDLSDFAEAIRSDVPHAFLCCLVELIPLTGNTDSEVFPPDTCLLSIPTGYVNRSPADKSVVFNSEGVNRLYGCRPGTTAIRVGAKQIVNDHGKLLLIDAPELGKQFSDPYHQYQGQNISVLELL